MSGRELLALVSLGFKHLADPCATAAGGEPWRRFALLLGRIVVDLSDGPHLDASYWSALFSAHGATPSEALLTAMAAASAQELTPAGTALLVTGIAEAAGVSTSASLSSVSYAVAHDISAVISSALEWLPGELDASAIEILVHTAYAVAAPSEEAVLRRATTALLGLGVWTEGVLLDLNIDALSFSGQRGVDVGLDGLVGYQFEDFGFSAAGHYAALEFKSTTEPALLRQEDRWGGSGAVWWSPSISSTLQLELRVEGGGAYIGSLLADDRSTSFLDEDSFFGFGLLGMGVRSQPTSDLGLSVRVLGGFQVEVFSHDTFEDGSFADDVGAQVDGMLSSNLRLEWHLWPQYLALRTRSEVGLVQMRRLRLQFAAGNGQQMSSQSVVAVSQLSSGHRLFVDAEALRFVGFVPSINAGIDVVARFDSSTTYLSLAPAFGGGVRRIIF